MMQINNTVRMIHFLPDEKVTNNFIDMLESVYPGESFYAVYGSSKQAKMTKIYGMLFYNLLLKLKERKFYLLVLQMELIVCFMI